MSFTANYPGVCTTPPGLRFAPPGDVDAEQRNESSCPDCHLIHAGECW